MDQLLKNLRAIIGDDAVLAEPDELLVYECDGLTQHKQRPRAVVFPHSTEEVAEVLRMLAREGVPFAPRGAGTGLSGGALTESIVIEMARMRRLLRLDAPNRRATVETGLINAQLSRAAAPFNLHYVPDPSSQTTCTIGGNIAENAGGIHCLKYGMTVDHVAAARVVLSDGEIVDLYAGGAAAPGYDLLGVFIGSEGTFGIATEATLILTPVAPAVRTLLADFPDVRSGSRAVSAIIAAGFMPSALEMMDGAAIRAVEHSIFAAGLPFDAEAALLIELDGLEAGLDTEAARIEQLCREHGARNVRRAQDERERVKFWAARKGAFGALGRLAPDLMLQDAVVPRSRLPEVLDEIYRIAAKYGLLVANVFHAGDGNLHPFICYDSRQPEEVKRVKEAGREMMETCVRAGGTITGEHGVGLDKSEYLPLVFSPHDMETMLSVRAAFDPEGLCNPGKIIPTSRSCGEARGAAKRRTDAGQAKQVEAATPERGTEAGLSSLTNLRVKATAEVREATAEGILATAEETGATAEVTAEMAEETGTSDGAQEFAASSTRPHFHASMRPHFHASQPVASQSPALLNRAAFNVEAAHTTLARIFGAEHVNASSHLASDASSSSSSPFRLSVSPANEEEACEVLRLAASEGWAVFPAGAGTWLDVGQSRRREGIVLQTSRMARILEHEPADLIAIAEAGVSFSQFNAQLNRAGQWLPLDPPGAGRASLGGIAATGMVGAQGIGYGAPRGYVIGMRVALADASVTKAGGRVVKNVAGYDLCKLFTGSYGTLGLITELTFKLRPLPAKAATLIASGSTSKLWEAARGLLAAQLSPVALELLSGSAATTLGVQVDDENSGALMMRFAGAAEAVDFQLEQSRSLLDGIPEIRPQHIAYDDEELWQALAALPVQHDGELTWRGHLPPQELGAMLVETERTLFPSGVCWHAGAGDGRLRVMLPQPSAASERIELLREWRSRVEKAKGWLIVESAPPEIKAGFDVWGDVGAAAGLMRRVKQQLDPAEMLSPGRFAAGL